MTFQKDLGSYALEDGANAAAGGEAGCDWSQSAECDVDAAALLTAVAAGEDRPDDRAGEGVYGAAGRGRRAVCAGAGTWASAWRWRSMTSTSRRRWRTRFRGRWRVQLLAIADRMQTRLRGCLGLGLEPTGSKDPFALRRAANGIVKILAESGSAADAERCGGCCDGAMTDDAATGGGVLCGAAGVLSAARRRGRRMTW